ncbi:MAG: PTS IIA-like nitrogen regulatory protein PtsN [Roseitalea porphyridii]|uniref:PTS IIA-like nitrogen-regulatory protein PtsN n=1 Tax=Roseitalea porphyridii TaxID=1852022 RepID=A0A4P6UX79_9HYPH|nr:PTS IIA-like nitrogen regulatory protein PtsN [Roseitalea porphyridii]QBK29652.1 PTS IIA-like nitrogen-regulatory protein PtsN [Roseitalea porphyridii]
MDLGDIIAENAVIGDLRANSKKQLLQTLSEHAADLTGLSAREIFDTVLQREKLGSTGVGNGIAIPHAKFPGFDRIAGVFARLAEPIDFDALDEQPVDLVFLLLAPENAGADHLKALSRVARLMREPARVALLRATTDPHTLYHHLVSAPASNAA